MEELLVQFLSYCSRELPSSSEPLAGNARRSLNQPGRAGGYVGPLADFSSQAPRARPLDIVSVRCCLACKTFFAFLLFLIAI